MSNEILMPALSPTMEEGTLAKWLVQEGDNISYGDLIAEIETDKATMEVESIYEGIVGKLFVNEGTEGIKVNTPIGVVLDPGEKYQENEIKDNNIPNIEDLNINKASNQPQISQIPLTKPIETLNQKKEKTESHIGKDVISKRIFISPLAKRIANENSIDISLIKGTGPNGRIIKQDIESFKNNKLNNGHPKIKDDLKNINFELKKNSLMRKTIAKRLVESSLNSPHIYLSIDCNIDNLLDFRSKINSEFGDECKLSVNDIIIKATATTLKKVPECNVSWENENTKFFNSSDISVAVAIEGGLITPIIKNAEKKGLHDISNEMSELVEKAKTGNLLPVEYEGGTFSISNLGMFGIKNFTAIINPPQSAILAVGAGQKIPIVKENDVVIANVMNVTLSCDHRIIDGAVGAKFLQVFKKIIENPVLMTL